jgi:hypothetical protein
MTPPQCVGFLILACKGITDNVLGRKISELSVCLSS